MDRDHLHSKDAIRTPPSGESICSSIINRFNDCFHACYNDLQSINFLLKHIAAVAVRCDELCQMPEGDLIDNCRIAVEAGLFDRTCEEFFEELEKTKNEEQSLFIDRFIHHLRVLFRGNDALEAVVPQDVHHTARIAANLFELAVIQRIQRLEDISAVFNKRIEQFFRSVVDRWKSKYAARETTAREICALLEYLNAHTLLANITKISRGYKFLPPDNLSEDKSKYMLMFRQVVFGDENLDAEGRPIAPHFCSVLFQTLHTALQEHVSKTDPTSLLHLLYFNGSIRVFTNCLAALFWKQSRQDFLSSVSLVPSSSASSPSRPPLPPLSLLSHVRSLTADVCDSWSSFLQLQKPKTPYCLSSKFCIMMDALDFPDSDPRFTSIPSSGDCHESQLLPLMSMESCKWRVVQLTDPVASARFLVATNMIEYFFVSVTLIDNCMLQSTHNDALLSALESMDGPQPLYRKRLASNSRREVDSITSFLKKSFSHSKRSIHVRLGYMCILIAYFNFHQRERIAISSDDPNFAFPTCAEIFQFFSKLLSLSVYELPLNGSHDEQQCFCEHCIGLGPQPGERCLTASSLFSVSANDVLFDLAANPPTVSASSPSMGEEFKSTCAVLKSMLPLLADMNSGAHKLAIYSIACGLYCRTFERCDTLKAFTELIDPIFALLKSIDPLMHLQPEFGRIHSKFICFLLQKFGEVVTASKAMSQVGASPLCDEGFAHSASNFVQLDFAKKALRLLIGIINSFLQSDPMRTPFGRTILHQMMRACGDSITLHMTSFKRCYSVTFKKHNMDGTPRPQSYTCPSVLEAEYKAEAKRLLSNSAKCDTAPTLEERKRKRTFAFPLAENGDDAIESTERFVLPKSS